MGAGVWPFVSWEPAWADCPVEVFAGPVAPALLGVGCGCDGLVGKRAEGGSESRRKPSFITWHMHACICTSYVVATQIQLIQTAVLHLLLHAWYEQLGYAARVADLAFSGQRSSWVVHRSCP